MTMTSLQPPTLGAPPASSENVYLSPHSDDICFSLASFARHRHCGTLLTVFSVSTYTTSPLPHLDESGERVTVTAIRLAEDEVFARHCGLNAVSLGYPDAQARGQRPFDPGQALAIAGRIKTALLETLGAGLPAGDSTSRPWLFCPAGIGGHVDHLAVLALVIAHADALERRYRIAFYEDLHYASNERMRNDGLRRLHRSWTGSRLRRHVWPLDASLQLEKMALVRLYTSQLTPRLETIDAYTPATSPVTMPHEAVWIPQSDRHQRPG